MTKFIKLTEAFQNGNNTPLLLNISCIKSIKLSDKGVDCHIYMTDAKYYFVEESVEEIWELLRLANNNGVLKNGLE